MALQELSNILKDKREWTEIMPVGKPISFPPFGIPVVIRIVDRKQVIYQDTDGIMYVEEAKVGRLQRGSTGLYWSIEPPYPLFDYSLVSENEKLKEGMVVSHWSKCDNNDLEFWKHRFDVRGDYDLLELKVDDKHKETVYRALMHASIYMRYAIKNTQDPIEADKMTEMVNAIYDLQSVMDCGGSFQKSIGGDSGVTSTESE